MRVKICGITTEAAAQAASDAGTDFIGFVFAPSSRQLTAEQAAAISKTVPATTKKVGVFVNETHENIVQIAKQAGLDMIQLHGDEPPELAESLPYPVIKAFRMNKEKATTINAYPCDYYLIDSATGPNRGGNGTTFDWKLLAGLNINPEKTILAGGLTPENVQEAITTTNPAGVDVSSGVERDKHKDLSKIKQFITNVKVQKRG